MIREDAPIGVKETDGGVSEGRASSDGGNHRDQHVIVPRTEQVKVDARLALVLLVNAEAFAVALRMSLSRRQ